MSRTWNVYQSDPIPQNLPWPRKIPEGLITEAAVRRCSSKKVFLKVLLYPQENSCARVSFLKKVAGLEVCNFIKKRLQHRCFLVNVTKFLRTARIALVVAFVETPWALIIFFQCIQNCMKFFDQNFFSNRVTLAKSSGNGLNITRQVNKWRRFNVYKTSIQSHGRRIYILLTLKRCCVFTGRSTDFYKYGSFVLLLKALKSDVKNFGPNISCIRDRLRWNIQNPDKHLR